MGKALEPAVKTATRLDTARRRLSAVEKQMAPYLTAKPPKITPPAMRQSLSDAQRDVARLQLLFDHGHKQGTPETYAQMDLIPTNRRQSPIDRMYESGQITIEQQNAANEIASVAEAIESSVGVRGASLEARVDNSGAGRDALVEHFSRVRMEIAYTAWRDRLPMPRRMYLDMVLTNRSLVATARVYGVAWRPARKRLIEALDRWSDIKEATFRNVDQEDVERVYAKLGGGILISPEPKPERFHDVE